MGDTDDAAIDMNPGGMDVVVPAVGVLDVGSRCASFKWSKEVFCGFPFTVTVKNFKVHLMSSKDCHKEAVVICRWHLCG